MTISLSQKTLKTGGVGRSLLIVSFLQAAGAISAADTSLFEVQTIQKSVPGSAFYTNTYAVLSPLPDGRVFVIWTAAAEAPPGHPPFHSGTKGRIYGAFSNDSGRSWTPPVLLIDSPHNDLDPHMVVSGSTIFVFSTTVPRPFDEFYEARSKDSGRTWSPPRPSPLQAYNSPAALRKLRNGAVVAVWNDSPEQRWPLVAAYSNDEGRSWSRPRVIVDSGFETSYPSVAEAHDGTILVTWQHVPMPHGGRDLKLARFSFSWLEVQGPDTRPTAPSKAHRRPTGSQP